MSERDPGVSRSKHFSAWLSRQARGRRKDTIAIIVLAIAGIVMMLGIFTQQKASLPSWLPVVGEEFEQISAEFSTAQAVTPGQGQSVDIAGIEIGKVTSVDLEDGHAVVGMDIQPKYMELIHPDAQLLLRPKTGLNDMIVEIDPGKSEESIEGGHRFPLAQTEPNTNLDAFLATLDTDTRQYIQLLVAGGAQGIGGRGKQLGNALRRFGPFVHYVAKLNKAVAARHVELANVINNFADLTTELSRHDAEIKRFVSSSDAALGDFANQQAAIQEVLVEFPATLRAQKSALASSDRFTRASYPALTGLIPQAQALAPAFRATERMFAETTRADPRPDSALHPRSPSLPDPRGGRRDAAEQDRAQLRQRRRRVQQLPQRARLQAAGQAELPLLPALAEPQLQQHLQPAGRWRSPAPRPRPHHLHRLLARLGSPRSRPALRRDAAADGQHPPLRPDPGAAEPLQHGTLRTQRK